jgi:Ca2+-binding EF-hand superfamily protein
MARLDINKDGYISREDFELMGKKLAEHSRMTEEETEATIREFLKVADMLNLKPGVKKTLKEAAKKANESYCSTMSPTDKISLVNGVHNVLFDAIDTNKDGHISIEEFKVYLNVIAPGTKEDDIVHSFDAIDTNKNGEISREEFLAAAQDFLLGVEETELSKAFLGPLLD